MEAKRLLDLWDVSREELGEILAAHPSVRGMVFGYLAEYKLRKMWFSDLTKLSGFIRYDDHDRKRKNDLAFTYRTVPITIEVKSLQTATIQTTTDGYFGAAQCDASDKRTVRLPSGRTVSTTCLLAGEFDLLAINCFGFGQEWKFAFVRNKDLPRTKFRGYPPEDAQYLLATLVSVTWPVRLPFSDEPYHLLDQIVEEKLQG